MLILARGNAAKHHSFHQILSHSQPELWNGEESIVIIDNKTASITLLLGQTNPGAFRSLRPGMITSHVTLRRNSTIYEAAP
jgi:hypothetical protein